MDSSKKYSNPSPEIKSNIISKLFFCWILPFFKYGYRNDLQVSDIYNATPSDLSERLGDKLERNWFKEIARASVKDEKPSLKRAIFKTFAKSYFIYGFYLLMQAAILKSLQPLVLAAYIHYFDPSVKYNTRKEVGWMLATGVIVLAFMNVILMHYCSLGCQRIGMRLRVACCSLVYRKLLRLSQSSLGKTAVGQVVNLLSNDVERFDIASIYLHYIWIMPFQFVLACYIMFSSVGFATLTGMIAITLQAIPLQGYLSDLQGKLRYQIAHKTDYRIKLMSEIVSGIQVIKMYAWEKPFEKFVEVARKLEIDLVTKTSYIKGFSHAAGVFTERLTLYLTMVTYVLLGNKISGEVAFSMAQLFNTVQLYMCIFFPNALSTYSEAKVTIRRLEEFLSLEENTALVTAPSTDIDENEGKGAIRISDVSASWTSNSIVDTLSELNLTINPGTLCCVVGNVGAGKSSFLQLLLKELPVKFGKLEIDGTISYASQEPWLFVSSIRNNILFGQPYIKNRYKNVVQVCALDKDLQQFPFGDRTLVGERGVSLSGGQRARINLARAVYSESDIVLLDDPLSAVDTHVAKHLFEECIMKYLHDKTRILVTHQLQFLKQADMIVVIDNGKIEKFGTYSELSENVLTSIEQSKDEKVKEEQLEVERRERLQSIASVASSAGKEEEPEETQELIEKGVIPLSTYIEYCRSGGSKWVLLFLISLLIIAQLMCNACDMWVSKWSNVEQMRNLNYLENVRNACLTQDLPKINCTFTSGTNFSATENITNLLILAGNNIQGQVMMPQFFYIAIYTVFIIAAVVLTSARCMFFFRVCMNASKVLHNKMFSNVLKAPMRFFDTNPSGRVLSRFSKDMGAMDEVLPSSALGSFQIFLIMFGIIMMVFIVNPWMVIPAVLLRYLFYKFRVIYLKSAQDIKRLDGVTRAPVFSHVSASLYGLSTIRSSGAQEMVAKEFDVLQNQHTSTWYLFIACSEAFGFYLDVISTVFLILVTFQFLVVGSDNNFGGDVGLVISSSMILTGMLQLGVRLTADVESNMISVERVMQYTKLQKEGVDLPSKKPNKDWPHAGKISFINTSLRYAREEPLVLKKLNITIEAGEKVGIVGRTGAGKSTLIASLFRLAPIEGIIDIDGIDTAQVPLEDLRSNISIIPQEPILFSATVRYNLDPFGRASDDVLWKALGDVELKNSVEGLDQPVSEGGSNFSAGQRQLMCLARAVVRNNKVLVMDEATANVDPHTDSLIQKTIRENFKDCTVLTIAHRLNTIMDSDKVLVMDFGRAVEFAHPHELLQKPDGFFTKMVKETGGAMEAILRQVAKEAYETTHSVEDVLQDAMEDENGS